MHQAVQKYLEIFYKTHNWDALENILDSELEFQGPLFRSSTASEYIEALRDDPPGEASMEIISEWEDEDDCSVFYSFSNAGRSTKIYQHFEFKNDKISAITTVFNPQDLRITS